MDSLLEPEDTLSREALRAPWGVYGRSATLGVVSLLSKLLLNVLNTTTVDNLHTLHELSMEREEGVGLITVCNHTSTVDDPAVISAMMPWHHFITEHLHGNVRWSLCAREICYRNALLGQFFQSGKVLPVVRGEGLSQPIMRTAAAEVARGRWLHIFPEGRVVYTGRLGPLRWGIGKIICDAVKHTDRDPIVLPFYHSGMGQVMPYKGRVPRAGVHVHVVVGQPLDLRDLTCRCNKPGEDQQAVWRDITVRVQQALEELEARAPPNVDQVYHDLSRAKQRAAADSAAAEAGAPPDGAVPV